MQSLVLKPRFFGCVSCYGDGISIFDHLFLRVDPVNMATVTVNECIRQKKSTHTLQEDAKRWDTVQGFETGIRVLMFCYFWAPFNLFMKRYLSLSIFPWAIYLCFSALLSCIMISCIYIYIHIQCTCTYSLIYVFLLCKCICILICTIFSHKT